MTDQSSASDRRGSGEDLRSMEWYRVTVDDALAHLGSRRDGLHSDEVQARREQYGPNRIREQEQVKPWRILLNQFSSPLIYVLLGALAATVAIQSYADAIVIGIVLVVNGTIGFIQEYQAETSVQSLMEVVSPKALVRRDGEDMEIDAQELVPGDIVRLEQGEVVPADVRLIGVQGLQVSEAPLTGESVPVNKTERALEDAEENLPPADQRNMAFMSTAATSGSGEAVVVAIGGDTKIGEIAEQVQEAEQAETPLQMRIDRLSKWITAAILTVAAASYGMGVLLGRGVFDMLLLAVALAVAAIPAGLPIVVTVALAIGVNRMSNRHAVIRNLPAVDTLGSCSAIVSDKTGTMTQNRMTVRSIIAGDQRFDIAGETHRADGAIHQDGQDVEIAQRPPLRDTLLVGLLANEAELAEGDDGEPSGDPMEVALLNAAQQVGMSRQEEQKRYPLRDTVPFRTEQRFMATVHDADEASGQGPLVLVKGAPERIAEMCDKQRAPDGSQEAFDPERIIEQHEKLASEGLRILAMAMGRGEKAVSAVKGGDPQGLTFVGMQGLLDPPRPSAAEAVDSCHKAGIRVLMVTGDHATTAAAMGRQVHLDEPVAGRGDTTKAHGEAGTDTLLGVRRGQELADLTEEELDRTLDETNVYARVTPGQKLRIVERLKARNEIVAVTGDGVNDAPALESAHLGAAMGSGTDVAKESSDMVITDDNFASVYAAVEEGRTAFRNIRMATFFLLSTGAADVLIILSALGFDWPLPLLPAQILWLNVVTNGIADVALAFEPGEEALYRRPPRPKHEGVLDRTLIERLVIVGIWLAVGTVAVFYWQWGGDSQNLTVARTAALTTLVLFQKVHVFNCRSEDVSVFRKSLLANKVLIIGVLTSLAVHVAALYIPWTQDLLSFTPLDLTTWLVAIGVAMTAIIVNELHKRFRPRPSGTTRRLRVRPELQARPAGD